MIPQRTPWKRWSVLDGIKLLDLYAKHAAVDGTGNLQVSEEHWKLIAAEFEGRTVCACKERYRSLNNARQGRPPRERPRKSNPERIRRTEDDRAYYQSPAHLPEPISITAFVLGDPLPGRSALDRKMQGAEA